MKKLLLLICISFASIESFSQKGKGLIFLTENEYRDIPLASVAMMGTLPVEKDLSDWFPIPGNQGQQSSCVGWAVAYGLKSYQEAVERRRKPINTNHYGSPSFIYNQIKIKDCDGGAYIVSALNLLKTKGTANLIDFPYNEYDCSAIPSNSINQSC